MNLFYHANKKGWSSLDIVNHNDGYKILAYAPKRGRVRVWRLTKRRRYRRNSF